MPPTNSCVWEYFNGVTDYIDVLNTLTDRQELRRNLLSAELELLEFRICSTAPSRAVLTRAVTPEN